MGRGRLKTPSALFWAYSAERNFLFAVSKLPFHGKGSNGEQVLKTADCLCDPCCENGVQESLQTFLNPIFTAGVAKAIGSFQHLFTVAAFPVKRQFRNCK